MQWYTSARLGRTQSLTPEGFLLCEAVPIARTGEMLYVGGEVPVTPGADGLIRITRDAEDVFADDTIASVNGKPVTDDHPPEEVGPSNWRSYAVGMAQNARRGAGIEDDILFADLLVTERAAIDAIREGKRGISCGYVADYEEIEPGRGRQSGIVVNHIALVDHARCGPRCSIGDHQMATSAAAAAPRRRTWMDRVRTAFRANDSDALEEALAERRKNGDDEDGEDGKAGGGARPHVVVHVHNRPGESDDAGDGGAEGEAGGDPDAAAAEAGGEGGDDAVSKLATAVQSITSRLDAIEDVVRELAGAESDDGEDEGDDDDDDDDKDNTRDAEEGMTGEVAGEPGETSTEAAASGDPGPAKRAAEGDPGPAPSAAASDAKDMTMDTSLRQRIWRETIALGEILAPGSKLPTRDAAATVRVEAETLCAFRRRALDAAARNEAKKSIIDSLTDGADVAKMTCDTVAVVFRGAAGRVREQNNVSGAAGIVQRDHSTVKVPSNQDINKRNREYWAARGT